MAQLKSSTIAGSVDVTAEMLADEIQINKLYIPTESNGSTLGPGTSNQMVKSNGTNVYWGADNNAMSGVKGNSETDYRTGQVNITPANIGAVAIAQGSTHAGKFLTVNSSGNVVLTAL